MFSDVNLKIPSTNQHAFNNTSTPRRVLQSSFHDSRLLQAGVEVPHTVAHFANALKLSALAGQLSNGINLFLQEIAFDVVCELSVILRSSHLVQLAKLLVDGLLHREGFLECEQGVALGVIRFEEVEVHLRDWCWDVRSASLVLVANQSMCVRGFLLSRFVEGVRNVVQCNVWSVKVCPHGDILKVGPVLHRNMLVQSLFALLRPIDATNI